MGMVAPQFFVAFSRAEQKGVQSSGRRTNQKEKLMPHAIDTLIATLESAANAETDFYAAAFTRYFELCPDSRELMQHTDELMRGRMKEQVVSLLMDADAGSLEVYFKFEVANHEAYGALPQMYAHLFQACEDVARENCELPWGSEEDAAWAKQRRVLLELIGRHSTVEA